MSILLYLFLAISVVVSLLLIIRLWKKEDHIAIKVVLALVTLTPFVGPLFYAFYAGVSGAESQSPLLQNRKGRGAYTHSWLSMRPLLNNIVKEKKPK